VAGPLLITGATGGLGLALVEGACAQGLSVVATGRSRAAQARIEALGARFVSADLTDPHSAAQLCKGCNAIIHAAALSSSWGDKALFMASNIDATRFLLDAARDQGVARFVYISSPSIFAAFTDRISIGPNDAPANPPLNAYAQTKLMGEQLVLAAASADFATVAIRPRAIVGPDDRVLLPRLVQLARRPVMPLPRGGRALIELTDVRDVVSATLSALDRAKAVSGRAYNISGGAPIKVADLAQRLAASLGLTPKLVPLPMPIAHLLATVAEAVASGSSHEPILTRYSLATLGYSQTFDLTPAKSALQWTPRYDAVATLLEQAKRISP
jgi:2-alkyl-3-oxoalkanoate reductase